jgi:hypothetical protein
MNRRKTLELRHLRSAPRARPGEPNRALDVDPVLQAPPQSFRRPLSGHAPTPFFARRSATRHRALAAWPGDLGPSLVSSLGGAPGVQSLRRFPPADGWIRRLKPAAWHSSGISADPGPRAVRDLLSAPIIFVGVTDRLLEKRDLKGARPGMRWRRLLGFAPVCGPFPRATSSRIVPALGFASCRVGGRTTAHPGGHVTAADHQPPEFARRITATGELPIRSWVCGDPQRSELHGLRELLDGHASCQQSVARAPRRRPFSVLMGLMPGRSDRCFTRRSDRLPV